MRSIRGETTTVLLVAVAAAALVGGGFTLPAFLQKKPPVAKLEQTQADLAAAKAAQQAAEVARDKAQADLAKVREDDQRKKGEQLGFAYQMAVGASEAIGRIPGEHKTSASQLAGDLIARSTVGLAAALGELPADKRLEIVRIVDQALSSKQAEIDAARAALARKDAELSFTIQERERLAAEVPRLAAEVTHRELEVRKKLAEVAEKDVAVTRLAEEVKRYATEAAAERARAGSIDAYAGNIARALVVIVLLWLVAMWVLPSLAQEFPGSRVLVGLNKTVKSILTAHL